MSKYERRKEKWKRIIAEKTFLNLVRGLLLVLEEEIDEFVENRRWRKMISMERKWEMWYWYLYSLRDDTPLTGPGSVPEWFLLQDDIYQISAVEELIKYYRSDKICLGMKMDREKARQLGELKRFRENIK